MDFKGCKWSFLVQLGFWSDSNVAMGRCAASIIGQILVPLKARGNIRN